MSANDGAIITEKPKSFRAQTACSREDPHPKFSFVTKIFEFEYFELFKIKSFFGLPSLSNLQL